MYASTIERPDARPETPNRPPTDDLICTCAGQEVPAAGPWNIGRGQRVTLVRRGLRRRSIEAVVFDGTYMITKDPAQSSLDLTLTFPGTVDLVKVSSGSARSIDIGFNGVFRQRGRPLSMWLVIRAALDSSLVPQLPGRGLVIMHAELNLNPLASLSAALVVGFESVEDVVDTSGGAAVPLTRVRKLVSWARSVRDDGCSKASQ